MCEGGGGHNSERLVSLKPELRPEILALAGRRNVFVADADPPAGRLVCQTYAASGSISKVQFGAPGRI
jgi:hypothetical protein